MRFTTEYAAILFIIQMLIFLIVTILQQKGAGEIKKTSTKCWSTRKVWKEWLFIYNPLGSMQSSQILELKG